MSYETYSYYYPNPDKAAAQARLQEIIDGKRPQTSRELFEATVDVVAVGDEHVKVHHVEDDINLEVGSEELCLGYCRAEGITKPSLKEIAYIDLVNADFAEMQVFRNNRIDVFARNPDTGKDQLIELTPDHTVALAELMLIGIS